MFSIATMPFRSPLTALVFFLMQLLCLVPFQARADYAAYSGKHEVSASTATLKVRHAHDWDWQKLDPIFKNLKDHDKIFSDAANPCAHLEAKDDAGRVLFRTACPALTHLWISPDSQHIIGLSNVMLRNPYQLVIWRRDGTLLHREHIEPQVSKLTAAQKQDFARLHPEANALLADHFFSLAGDAAVYVDFLIMGMPGFISPQAWDFLKNQMVAHPYSADFNSTVTNHVYWFDEARPEPVLTLDPATAKPVTLTLRSPKGDRFTIPLTRK